MQTKRLAIKTLWFCLGCGLVALTGCAPVSDRGAPAPTVAQAAPPPAGAVRVWILRQWDPINMVGEPMVYANGAPLARALPGTAYYRDLAPGPYTFSVETCGTDVNQAQTLNLAPGSQVDLEIQSLQSFTDWGCLQPHTFYVRAIPHALAQRYFEQLSYLGPR